MAFQTLKMIMISTAVALLCACSSGSNSNAPATSASSPANPAIQNPPNTPIDYSKVRCGHETACQLACEVTSPTVPDSTARQILCPAQSQNSASCDALILNLSNLSVTASAWCNSLKVTEVMRVQDLTSSTCSANTSCVTVCGLKFKPKSIQEMESGASAYGGLGSGAFQRALFSNELERAQLDACLDAPTSFIYNL